ncbi:MAG: hypothetical protein P8J87_20465, partial [Verrucomicrobiales bacterium]|nr:hypothetical protein [Verrucomicrobiales bacterium]
RAVAVQCAVENCESLILVNRTQEKVDVLAAELRPYLSDERVQGPDERISVCPWDTDALHAALDHTDLIVNATSIGMKRTDPELLPAHLIQPHHMVYDMIYSPPRTKLLAAAEANGARTANGLSMLVHQGAISFEHWFNRPAPVDIMRSAVLGAVES